MRPSGQQDEDGSVGSGPCHTGLDPQNHRQKERTKPTKLPSDPNSSHGAHILSAGNCNVGVYLICSQSTPSKKGLFFISSTPGAPILCSHSQQNLEKTGFQHTPVSSEKGVARLLHALPTPQVLEKEGRARGVHSDHRGA